MTENGIAQELGQEYLLICQQQMPSLGTDKNGMMQSILLPDNAGGYKILQDGQYLVKQEASEEDYELLSEMSYQFTPCEQCAVQENRSGLRIHLMSEHGLSVEQSTQLENHLLSDTLHKDGRGGEVGSPGSDQNRKVFTCHICNKKFNQSCNLKTHMRVHTGERPFECPDCGRFFTNKVNLQTHMRTHTGEKPFRCVICYSQFTQVSSLKVHMRSHTGERPYICRECSRGFTKSSDLNRHMKTHLEQRPYRCRECQRGFTQMNSLQMHMRLHYDYRPYVCFICDKRFARVSCLKAHTRLHTDLLSNDAIDVDRYEDAAYGESKYDLKSQVLEDSALTAISSGQNRKAKS